MRQRHFRELSHHVVLVESDVFRRHFEWNEPLAGLEPLELRDQRLDHEVAAGVQMCGGIREARHLLGTAQQLGSAIGTALIGAVVISALVAAFVDNISDQASIPADLSNTIEIEVSSGSSFVAADQVAAGLADAGVNDAQADAVVEQYREAQLQALKIGLLLAGFLSVISLAFTRSLPGKDPELADAGQLPVSA